MRYAVDYAGKCVVDQSSTSLVQVMDIINDVAPYYGMYREWLVANLRSSWEFYTS